MPRPEGNSQSAVSPMTGQPGRFLFSNVVLCRHLANYYIDDDTGFIFVDQPHWLKEAYNNPIAQTDTGILARNLKNVELVRLLLERAEPFKSRQVKGIDLAGGYGLFVRGMRDAGHRFYWSDKYSENLVAKGFEAADEAYDVAVAFEVLEHVQNPLEFLSSALEQYKCETILFSATCFDESCIPDCEWWYWAFETGQHISFFTERSLKWISNRLSMELCHIDGDVFAMSRTRLSLPSKATLVQRGMRRLLKSVERLKQEPGTSGRPSLTLSDHLVLKQRLREQQVPRDNN